MDTVQVFYGHENVHLVRVFDLQILPDSGVIADHLVPLIASDSEVFVNDQVSLFQVFGRGDDLVWVIQKGGRLAFSLNGC